MDESRLAVAVEILHTAQCPHWRSVGELADRIALEEGIAVAISQTRVETADEAVQRRFPGSPTVRVEGVDVQPEAEALEEFGLG